MSRRQLARAFVSPISLYAPAPQPARRLAHVACRLHGWTLPPPRLMSCVLLYPWTAPLPSLAASEVFVVGGGNGVEWFDSVARYDRAAGLMGGWTELAPLQVGGRRRRRSAGVVVCGGAGRGRRGRLASRAERTGRAQAAPCGRSTSPWLPGRVQVARGSLSAGLAGGYLFAYGGGKPNEQYNVVEWCAARCCAVLAVLCCAIPGSTALHHGAKR